MRALISLLLIAALTSSALCNADCDEDVPCPPDAQGVCVFHPELYCFTKFENICYWNRLKCKYNLNFQIFAIEFCDLENFACRHPNNEQKVQYSSF